MQDNVSAQIKLGFNQVSTWFYTAAILSDEQSHFRGTINKPVQKKKTSLILPCWKLQMRLTI